MSKNEKLTSSESEKSSFEDEMEALEEEQNGAYALNNSSVIYIFIE